MDKKGLSTRWRHTLLALSLTTLCAHGADEPSAGPPNKPAPAVAGWQAFVDRLETMPGELLAQLPKRMREDPQIQQEVARLVLQSLTLSSISALGGDGDHPAFLPGIGELLNVGQPNADTLYRMTPITPGGTYRLRGKQGSLNTAVIGQVGAGSFDAGGDSDHPGATRNYLELGSLSTDSEGRFDVILSTERPENHEGDWWQLHPKTHRLLLRLVSSDWGEEEDPTIAIERLDAPVEKPRSPAPELERDLRRLPQATAFMAGMFVDKVVELRREGYINELKEFDVSGTGGLDGQFYYEGAYDLAEDEALILEAKHPEHCEYRSLILTNELYQTTDWYNNHSSLNGSQAEVDADGVLRIVVSEKDPGVPNWLDTAGYPRGVVQGRWTHCTDQPIPSVKKVAVDRVRDHLPEDTPEVTPAERETLIRERRADYQQRPHW